MLIGDEAREIFKTGLHKVHTAVAPTLGPAARTVALKRNGRTIVINDGVTIARKVWSEDSYEQMGIDLIWGGDWDGDTDLKDNAFDDLVHFELS